MAWLTRSSWLCCVLSAIAFAQQQRADTDPRFPSFKPLLMQQMQENSYDPTTAPDFPQRTSVNLTIWPLRLRYVNERLETVQVNTWIKLQWFDKRLAVAPTALNSTNDTANCLVIKMRDDQIWTPSLRADEQTFLTETPFLNKPYVTVDCKGNVQMRAIFLDETSCLLRMRMFPFEQQKCYLTINSEPDVMLIHTLLYPKLETTVEQIEKETMKGDDKIEYDAGSWALYASRGVIKKTFDDVTATVNNESRHSELMGGSIVRYKFYITRKPSHYVLDWIVPPILLSTTGIVTMFAGCDVTERHSVGGTLVVTLTLMLGSLREHMAVAYDGYPILAQVYMGLMSTTILATLLAALPRHVAKRIRDPKRSISKLGLNKVSSYTGSRAGCELSNVKLCGQNPKDALTERHAEQTLDFFAMAIFLAIEVAIVGYAGIVWYGRKIY